MTVDQARLQYGQPLPPEGTGGIATKDLARVQKDAPVQSERVALVSIAPTNTLPWHQIANELQGPNFTFTSDQLYHMAITTTSAAQNSQTSRIVAQIAGAFAGAQVSRKDETTTSGDVTTRSTSDKTSYDTPATPTIGDPKGQVAAAPTSGISGFTPATDARITMQAAAALREEMAILDHRIKGLTADRGYMPYFVQLPLSIVPRRHGYPYDVTVRLEFSANSSTARTAAGIGRANAVSECLDMGKAGAANNRDIRVLPLVATDAYEATSQIDIVDIATQLGLALQGSNGLFGGAGKFESTLQKINQSQALRINSQYVLSAVSSNCVQIRIGANRYGNSYEMVPRNNAVSLVVLVPKALVFDDELTINIAGKAYFTDPVHYVKGRPFADPEPDDVRTQPIYLSRIPKPRCPEQQSVLISAAELAGKEGKGGGASFAVASVAGTDTINLYPMSAILEFSAVKGKSPPLSIRSSSAIIEAESTQFVFPNFLALFQPEKNKSSFHDAKLILSYKTDGAERLPRPDARLDTRTEPTEYRCSSYDAYYILGPAPASASAAAGQSDGKKPGAADKDDGQSGTDQGKGGVDKSVTEKIQLYSAPRVTLPIN